MFPIEKDCKIHMSQPSSSNSWAILLSLKRIDNPFIQLENYNLIEKIKKRSTPRAPTGVGAGSPGNELSTESLSASFLQ